MISDDTRTGLQTEVAPRGLRFEPAMARPFCEKSVSEETRRAYHRVVREFFGFVKQSHPRDVTVEMVLSWRGALVGRGSKAATISFKLSVIRSLFEYLKAAGVVETNPASTRFVTPPVSESEAAGKALTVRDVAHLIAGPDRLTIEGARDYALLLLMLRTSLRVSEVCSLKTSSVKTTRGRQVITVKVKGGKERLLPLPDDVRRAIGDYLDLDRKRRALVGSGHADAYLFQPTLNYRTLIFDKPLSTRMVRNIVARWGDYTGIGKLSPHDLRRTAITRALDQGLSYRQVQMMTGHKDPKTVMLYDRGRENLDLNAINFLSYD
jgi:integrase/recombinase XerD